MSEDIALQSYRRFLSGAPTHVYKFWGLCRAISLAVLTLSLSNLQLYDFKALFLVVSMDFR